MKIRDATISILNMKFQTMHSYRCLQLQHLHFCRRA